MHLVYIDDSKDPTKSCFSAISVPEDTWQTCLDRLVDMRKALASSDGIYVRHEIHATDWLAGRGNIAKSMIPKGRRVALFNYVLSVVSLLPGVQVFNAAVGPNDDVRAFEWLLNRINVNMSKAGSRAMLISDEGKSYDALLRRMRRFNPIPSRFGSWGAHGASKNLTLNRIVEDISYRDSARSLFVQMADCCAFSLLRYEVPTAKAKKYGFDQSFKILEPVMVKRANGKDPLGIIR